jgi:hypothetical protein
MCKSPKVFLSDGGHKRTLLLDTYNAGEIPKKCNNLVSSGTATETMKFYQKEAEQKKGLAKEALQLVEARTSDELDALVISEPQENEGVRTNYAPHAL